MKHTSVFVAVAASALLALFAAPASAGGQFCYSADVVVNGGTVVSEAGCVPIG